LVSADPRERARRAQAGTSYAIKPIWTFPLQRFGGGDDFVFHASLDERSGSAASLSPREARELLPRNMRPRRGK